MNIKNLMLILLAVGIIFLNYFYGNAISWTLSIAIVASIIYYFSQLSIERLIMSRLKGKVKSQEAMIKAASISSKYRKLTSFALLTVVFASSIFTIRKVMMPRENTSYFFNNDYHAISNDGIAFTDALKLTKQELDETNGNITIKNNGENVLITSNNFYQPIFAFSEEDKPYKIINNIYPQKIQKSFGIENGSVKLNIEISEHKNFFKKLIGGKYYNEYKVTIANKDASIAEEENLSYNITDAFTFRSDYLQRGMSLYNIFYRQEIVEAPKKDGLRIAQELLYQIANCLIIKDQSKEGGYYFFPDKAFHNLGFRLTIDGKPAALNLNNTASISKNQLFYIGFNNRMERMSVMNINDNAYQLNNKSVALIYDHPPSYWLANKDEETFLHNVSTRFITNDYNEVIDGKSNEGFYFNNFGIKSEHTVNARLQFITEKATDSFRVHIRDIKAGKESQLSPHSFSLATENANVKYLFKIRDFSDNGFSFGKVLLYAGIIYLSMLIVLLFFPGKNLARIEPVTMVVVYVLSVVRMIMYWRVATFPPLENISKHELEKTMINFDFNLGFQLPIPLTLIWVLLFLATLIIYRKLGKGLKDRFYHLINSRFISSKRNIYQSYTLMMFGLLIIYFLNSKLLHIEVLTRILSIIVPLLLYIIFSIISNKKFTFNSRWVQTKDSKILTEFKAYFHYLFTNPAFYLSLVTLLYFAITDRGFAVVFLLFLILKNVLLNLLKKSYNSTNQSWWQMISKANNYWIYGISALVLYFIVLSVKSLFYYILQYYLVFIGLGLVLLIVFLFFKEKKTLLKVTGSALVIFIVLSVIPFTRNIIDSIVYEQIKHTQYRVSILHQPLSDLLLENEYSSFSTRKIIETAENQWFINSYISKEFDNNHTLNLRPYNRVGVDYNTQTRDVVLSRFVISEMGNFVMYLLLILIALPLIIYLMSYKFTQDQEDQYKVNPKTYPGIIPLIFLFTIALFVWLTATNRFVFFGQDFPFLSLTSKTSVVLPLLLFGIVLSSEPKSYESSKIGVARQVGKYVMFMGLIAFFALITVQKNVLNSRNFSVVVKETQEIIDNDFNAVLYSIQDSISVKNPKYKFEDVIAATHNNAAYQTLMKERVNDPYSRSIIERVVKNPYSAYQVNSPLYIRYDGNKYHANYNQHFYLELPPVDPAKVWHGSISEAGNAKNREATLTIDGNEERIMIPYFSDKNDKNIKIAVIPHSWLSNANGNLALIDVSKDVSPSTRLSVFKDMNNSYEQKSTSFVSSINSKDLVAIEQGDKRSTLSYFDNAHLFAINKWVNGQYRILYPHRPKQLWIYHFAQNVKSIYNDPNNYRSRFEISLDYNLNKDIESDIHNTYGKNPKLSPKFKYAVIAADGDGNIRLMQDFVSNRKIIDPNEHYKIFQLQQQQFFFSNISHERDQWGESNLLNMQLGPGSSIKPLVAALVASQVNAGWEHLVLSVPNEPEYNYYSGLRLHKPWKNDDHLIKDLSMAEYIEASSNFYQSTILFLGSYSREAFIKNGKAALTNILTTTSGKNNSYPSFNLNGTAYYFPNYNSKKGNWPKTDFSSEKNVTFFGNENSIIANGFEINANIMTKEKNKDAASRGVYDRINLIDSNSYAELYNGGNSSFLWSMPEQSSYFQYLRAYKDIHQNFNVGLKANTLGGYPYQLSTFKLLEAYTSLFTQNRSFRLHLDRRQLSYTPWHTDSTWQSQQQFHNFLAQNIFKGMHNVIFSGAGTLKNFASLSSKYPGFYFYAKTGTINEEQSGSKSSRRIVLVITDRDMQDASNIGKAKVYTLFFMVDRNQNFSWTLENEIIDQVMKSNSFKDYFGKI